MENITFDIDKQYTCECGKVCGKKFNLTRHQLTCKHIKNKTQVETQHTQQTQQNDQQIIAELRAQIAMKDSQIAIKDYEIDSLKRMLEFTKQQLDTPQYSTLPVIQSAVKTDVKKMNPLDFLLENIDEAYDAYSFMNKMEVTVYDILESNKSDPVEWFVNIIDRNIKNKCNSVEQYPFHSIINSNTHKRLIYIKIKDDDKKINEWSCEEQDIDTMLCNARIALNRKCAEINKVEQAEILNYKQKCHIPEYDDFNREIIINWKSVPLENENTEIIFNIRLMISSLSDKTKAILKILTDKYAI